MRKSFDKHWYAWAMVIPTVIVLGVLVFYPLVQGVWQSFTNLNESNQRSEICTKVLGGAETCKPNPDAAEFVGIDNYVDILTGAQGHFWLQFSNTLVWTVACVALHFGIGLGLAVMLNREFRGQHHPAGPATGQLDRGPARHHLDLQHVPDHLLRDAGPAGRRDGDPGDRGLPRGVRGHP